ncbi:MAG: putative transposase for insertion sequence element [Geminicoccaceae bacterium]|jgi:hypothetical protein|nr:putative transposase for insertion sequence element [Geminicoccaceae bacterium]
MALGWQGERQTELMVGWAELPRSPGHAFYDRLQAVLVGAGFDRFAESECKPYYASGRGRPSLPPGRYFRMHLVGYFEGINSERGLERRCAGSLSLREFLRLGTPRAGAGPLLAEPDPIVPAAGGARGGLRLGARAPGRARPDQRRADRDRCVHDGGQRQGLG